MGKLESISINWEAAGAKLANLSDTEQSQFFRGFANEMKCYESKYLMNTQLASINIKLTKDERKVFLPLGYEPN